jgi:hypothetical protein
MNRTLTELAPNGNPFREMIANAKLLLPRRSQELQRRWATGEAPGLGVVNTGVLATYGLVAAHRSVRSWNGITSAIERWMFPELPDIAGGQVGRVEIARYAIGDQPTRTTALIMSPAMDDRLGRRSGVRVDIESERNGPYLARVHLVATDDALREGKPASAEVLHREEYGGHAQDALDGREVDDLRYHGSIFSAAHAVLPLVVDCNRVLAELAAGTEARNYTSIPIGPLPR